jgi:putative membrane protein
MPPGPMAAAAYRQSCSGRAVLQVILALPAMLLLHAPDAVAHAVPTLRTAPLWQAWSTELWVWLVWGLPGLLILSGYLRLWRRAGEGAGLSRGRAVCFLAGFLVLGLAILSPLDAIGEELFWVHMVQHEVLLLVAAPLLVLSRPLGALVWALPATWRPGSAVLAERLGLAATMRWMTRPFTAWWIHAVVLWAWHAPALFEAALTHRWVHDLQHVSFLVSSLAFWWALLEARGGAQRQATAVLYLFTTLLHTSALGALLTFSQRAWYAPYAVTAPHWGLDVLEDQQLGGLIMWVPGGTVFLVAALASCAAWLRTTPRPLPGMRGGQ